MMYTGYCPELNRNHTVTREDLNADTFNQKATVRGLIDCRYAAECTYLKEHKKCALIK